jgi:predicted Zn-dependent protease
MESSEASTTVCSLHFQIVGAFHRSRAEELIAGVSRRLAVPCRLLSSPFDERIPLLPDREQVDADALLERLEHQSKPMGTVTIGLTMRDLGVRIFTFVFGQARYNGHVALVSLARLQPEFYGLAPDPRLTSTRAVAEILHEVGHVLGLSHCGDFGCLMHFANNVETIDLRGNSFCSSCTARLPSGIFLPAGRA